MTSYLPDPAYNPEFQETITGRTKLAKGITIAKFLGGYGDQVTLNHIATEVEKKRIAKQLYLHGQVMLSIAENDGEFEDYRLVVAEGLYKTGDNETLKPGSINDLMRTGQAVVYELLNSNGYNAVKETFDLAVYWKDNLQFEKMILDYDTYNPNGSLNAQIILVMPKIQDPWNVNFKNELETRFNNYVQSTNELIEILV